MSPEAVTAMKKARAESKRALKAIEALLEYNFDGHATDRADASRSCLDALICALNVEIADYEWRKDEAERAKEVASRAAEGDSSDGY